MNVLLAGGAGYLGGATADELVAAGHKVWVYDALLFEDLYLRDDVDFECGNVLDDELLLPHLKGADAVVWLAGMVGDASCAAQPEVAGLVNADVVQWLRANFDGRIVFPSTCSVYGKREGALAEDAEVAPLSVYGQTKVRAEGFLAGTNTVVYRLGTLFGMGSKMGGRFRMDLVVNGMTARACRLRAITVDGGKQWRPLLHVRDAARAMVAGLDGEPGTYNLVGQNMRIEDLAGLVAAEVPGVQVTWTDGPQGVDLRDYRVIADKAAAVLGFYAPITVEQGIREIAKMVRSGRLASPNSPRFHNREHQLLTWGR